MDIQKTDYRLIHIFRAVSVPLARLALFVIYFWFGLLKVIGFSPASPLVSSLLERTMPFMSFPTFIVLFGLFEMLIGLLFIIPRCERVVIPLLFFHMITTAMPLFLLPQITWTAAFVPTLEGQYIIKNLALIASAAAIVAHMHPMKHR